MDFDLGGEHRLMRETARRVAREVVAPSAAEIDETDEYPEDIFQVFAQAGLLGLTIPEAYGGSGAGFLALALAVEETAKHDNGCSLILLLSRSPRSRQPRRFRGTEARVALQVGNRRDQRRLSASPSPTPAPTHRRWSRARSATATTT